MKKITVSREINDADGALMTQVPVKQKSKEELENEKKEKDEMSKQEILIKKIRESEEKLKFEKEQRENLLSQKKKEIDKKDKTIQQMTQTNQKLQNELETLQVEVQEKLDKIEFKEKNDIFENEKKKRQNPLEQLLKVKQKELKNATEVINNLKKGYWWIKKTNKWKIRYGTNKFFKWPN